jgi:hypothetical protein
MGWGMCAVKAWGLGWVGVGVGVGRIEHVGRVRTVGTSGTSPCPVTYAACKGVPQLWLLLLLQLSLATLP